MVAKLKELSERPILPKDFDAATMLSRDIRARLKEANGHDFDEWSKITTREEWETFRDQRLALLKKSLGDFPEAPRQMKTHVVKTIEGDGYKIENTLFESRPGLWVTANVYSPAKPLKSMPGILIVHSHHNPKEQGELQDMGVTWARAGCVVLVPDQLGHGERRVHPFVDAKSYSEPFKVSRQDYYFRYNLGMQLGLIGESLAGWIAWDLMRGVDLLLARPGIDPERIILLGSVAGGGDPAAVAAALDPRIKCLVPFNFGGLQPETKKLGNVVERTFNYAGSGSWESTRNLRDSARDDFMPWLIVASIAPRHLIHAHEFAWDDERDPVWRRYQKIWGFYHAKDRLSLTHGSGSVSGKPPESTHCNNIGEVHRKSIHPSFEKWFGIKAVESKDRRPAEELKCWTPEMTTKLNPKPPSEVIAAWGDDHRRMERVVLYLKAHSKGKNYRGDGREWAQLLPVDKKESDESTLAFMGGERMDGCQVRQLILGFKSDIRIPFLLLTPAGQPPANGFPIVFGLCQEGKQRFVNERLTAIAKLLRGGAAVCLVDARGVGETAPGKDRGRNSASTSLAYSENMLGRTLLGDRLGDFFHVMRKVIEGPGAVDPSWKFDKKRMAIWGESFAPVNLPKDRVVVPQDADPTPKQSEPLGGLLAVLAAAEFPDLDLRAIVSRGSLLSYRSVMDSPFVYAPADHMIPRVLETTGDIPMALATIGQCSIRIEGPVDGLNRRVPKEVIEKNYAALLREVPQDKESRKTVSVRPEMGDELEVAKWLLGELK